MDKNIFLSRIEPFIIYMILYFPALHSGGSADPAAFYKNSSMIIFYSAVSLFQIFFLLYFMKLKKTGPERSGIIKLSYSSISKSLIYAACLMIIVILVNSILSPFIKQTEYTVSRSASFILKALSVSLLTGYREELFFRSYFISSSENFYGKIISVFISTILFSVSHITGGITAVISALCAGFFLSFIFIRHRDLHINSLAHSIYNFAVLIFS